LVLDAPTVKRLGTAVVSGASNLLYGPPGTGKTSVAEVLPSVYGDGVWIPYAIEVGGQIITVYDRGIHQRIDDRMQDGCDGRWVLCKRPRVMVGGELTIEMLDLLFDPVGKLYSAPIQMKANNGVLIVDDFGRQLVRPEALLNRWIVPLDRGIDFLTLGGGKKFEIPFDLFLVFASNLEPSQLGDEAFLRRIANKIKIDYLREDQFHEIFRRVCAKFQLDYDPDVTDSLIKMLTRDYNEPLRACQPRDIIRQTCFSTDDLA
jgi:predicted ATPase with chaperone activity